MKPELQEKLMNTFPKIFVQKDLSYAESCMCWGVEAPSSWFTLLYELCTKIQDRVDNHGLAQVEATQVKEKFGTLRFYYIGGNIDDLVEEAELKSEKICAECGNEKNVKASPGGWINYLCEDCINKD